MNTFSFRSLLRFFLALFCLLGSVDFLRADEVYVLGLQPRTVTRYDRAGQFLSKVQLPSYYPGYFRLALDPAGNFCTLTGTSIRVFSQTGKLIRESSGYTLSSPSDLAVGSDGTMYVSDRSGIAVFNPAAAWTGTWSGLPSTTSRRGGLALSSTGLYAATTVNDRVDVFDLAGTYHGLFSGTSIDAPSALALDSGDHLYVSQRSSILMYDGTNGLVRTLTSPGMSGQLSMACDSDDQLYVLDASGGFIELFSPAGDDFGEFVGTTTFTPTGIAIKKGPDFDYWGQFDGRYVGRTSTYINGELQSTKRDVIGSGVEDPSAVWTFDQVSGKWTAVSPDYTAKGDFGFVGKELVLKGTLSIKVRGGTRTFSTVSKAKIRRDGKLRLRATTKGYGLVLTEVFVGARKDLQVSATREIPRDGNDSRQEGGRSIFTLPIPPMQ